MGVLVSCGGASKDAILSLDEKIFYADKCISDCSVRVEKLAAAITGTTEKQKQEYIGQFSLLVECENTWPPIEEEIKQLEALAYAARVQNNFGRNEMHKREISRLRESLRTCSVPNFLAD